MNSTSLKKSILIIITVFSFNLFAEGKSMTPPNLILPTGRIQGRVIDHTNKKALIGVNVLIQNTVLGASTNHGGEFAINHVPIGINILVVSYMGYESERRTILVERDKSTIIDFSLQPGFLESSTVVVTGTATPYLYQDAPVKTEVIPRKLIEQTQSCNLAEAMSLQTGVRVENNCQNCNFTQVRILGFDGRYSQLLIDGDPVVSTLAGVYALEQFPNEMIAQIEIVKGGGSALYGGGAMAGTINLRTKQPNFNRSRLSYDTQALGNSMDHRVGVVSELVSNDGRTGAFIYGSARQRDHYDYNGDSFSELGTLSHESIGANWYFRPKYSSEFQASFHRIIETRRGGNDFDRPEHEADIAESLSHDRWGGKLRWLQQITNLWDYQAHYSFSLLDRNSYYGGLGGNTAADSLDALNYYGHSKNKTHVAGLSSTYTLGTHQFTFGSQLSSDMLEDKSVKDSLYYIEEIYINNGFYLQDDFTLLDDNLNLIIGTRFDKHSEMSNLVISPRLNAKYKMTDDLNLRAALTTGFKAPQTFDEDLHIESLGGDQRVVRNAPDLGPEQIQSISAGFEYEGFINQHAVLVGITTFYSKLENAYTEVENSDASSDLILWQRINSDGATVSGIEVDLGFKPSSASELRLGVTYKQAAYESDQEIFDGIFSKHFLRTPDLFGHFRASYDITNSFNFFGSGRYTGKMFVPDETIEEIVKTSQTFTEFDAGVNWNLPTSNSFHTKFSCGVKNITDAFQEDLQKGKDRDPAYVYGPQLPRRLYLGVDVSF